MTTKKETADIVERLRSQMTEEELRRENEQLRTIIELRKQVDALELDLNIAHSKIGSYRQLFNEMISWRHQYINLESDFVRGVLYFLGSWTDRAKFFLRTLSDEKEFEAHIDYINQQEENLRNALRAKKEANEAMKNRKIKKVGTIA